MKITIEPDSKYIGMYRIRRDDGTLSDMVNLTRAKDALRAREDQNRRRRNDEHLGR